MSQSENSSQGEGEGIGPDVCVNHYGEKTVFTNLSKGSGRLRKFCSRTRVDINYSAFLEEFFIYFLWPFSFPYLYHTKGWAGVVNRQFIGWKPMHFEQFVSCPLLIFICAVALSRSECGGFLPLVVAVFHFFHACVIAMKYAVLPDSFMTLIKERILTQEFLKREQLLTGWAKPDLLMLEREVLVAGYRNDIILDHLFFHGVPQHLCSTVISRVDRLHQEAFDEMQGCEMMSHAERGRGTEMKADLLEAGKMHAPLQEAYDAGLLLHCQSRTPSFPFELPKGVLPAKHLLLAILQSSTPKWSSVDTIYPLAKVLAFVMSTTPLIGRLYDGESLLGDTPLDTVVLLGSIFIAVRFLTLIYAFQVLGVIDYYRRYSSLRLLAYVIAGGYTYRSDVELRQTITSGMNSRGMISLRDPLNVRNYVYCRQILRDFGYRFNIRVQLYSSVFILSTLCMILLVLVGLYHESVISYAKLSHGWVLVGCIHIGVQTVLVCLTLFHASNANLQILFDETWLRREQLDMMSEVSTSEKCEESKKLQLCAKVIDYAINTIKSNAEADPIRFLGVRASVTFTRSIFATFFSAFFIILRNLWNGEA